MITILQLKSIMPNAGSRATTYLPLLNQFMMKYSITGRMRECHFLAQIAHESGELSIKTNAESIVNSIDKYKDDVCRCDTLLAELDPEFKREQSYEQRFSKIEKALDKLADSNDKITDLLTQLTQ